MDRLEESLTAYELAWLDMGITIWQDQLRKLRAVRKGSLYRSFGSKLIQGAEYDTLEFTFLEYGLYVDSGVGYGYRMFNDGGDLKFLDKEVRAERGLDKPRKRGPKWGGGKTSGNPRSPRRWYLRKLYSSVKVLQEHMALIAGDSAAGVICDALNGL